MPIIFLFFFFQIAVSQNFLWELFQREQSKLNRNKREPKPYLPLSWPRNVKSTDIDPNIIDIKIYSERIHIPPGNYIPIDQLPATPKWVSDQCKNLDRQDYSGVYVIDNPHRSCIHVLSGAFLSQSNCVLPSHCYHTQYYTLDSSWVIGDTYAVCVGVADQLTVIKQTQFSLDFPEHHTYSIQFGKSHWRVSNFIMHDQTILNTTYTSPLSGIVVSVMFNPVTHKYRAGFFTAIQQLPSITILNANSVPTISLDVVTPYQINGRFCHVTPRNTRDSIYTTLEYSSCLQALKALPLPFSKTTRSRTKTKITKPTSKLSDPKFFSITPHHYITSDQNNRFSISTIPTTGAITCDPIKESISYLPSIINWVYQAIFTIIDLIVLYILQLLTSLFQQLLILVASINHYYMFTEYALFAAYLLYNHNLYFSILIIIFSASIFGIIR